MTRPPARRDHTDLDLQNARTKGQVVGWVQGGVATIGALVLLRFLGWIPVVIVAGVLGFVAIKLLTARKS